METGAIALSILIVNWNTRDLLLDALRSIQENAPPFPIEVVVVDNASSDGSAEAVAQAFPEVVLVASETNLGYAVGNNRAVAAASGSLLLFLNSDVLVRPDCLQTVAEFMNSHSDCGGLGIKQVHPDGKIQRSLRGFPTPMTVLFELFGLSRLFSQSRLFGAYRMTWFDYNHTIECDQPMGTFLLTRRAVIDRIGVFDEQFPIFFNEVDWCLRCKQAGWKIWYTPDAEILHYGGASTSLVADKMAWESRAGLLRYYKKHYPSPFYLPLRIIIAATSWLHAAIQAKRRKR